MLNTLIHHCEAVLHLRFNNGMMVTCSKDRSIAVWDMASPTDITLRRVLVGHRAAVNVVDFDDKYIVSASGDRTIKVRYFRGSFICGTEYLLTKSNDQTGKMVFGCYYTALPLEGVFLLLISTHPSFVELVWLVDRAVWQVRSRCRCIWERTLFSLCSFSIWLVPQSVSALVTQRVVRGQHGGKSKGEWVGVTWVLLLWSWSAALKLRKI